MNTKKQKSTASLEKVIGISIFSALAFVVAFVCNIIPPISGFLSLDVKDAVIAIAAFIYGPVSGLIIAFIAAFIEFLTFSTTAWYGLIMNFASSAVFTLTASLIYKKIRTINGAIIAFTAAVIATTGVMLLLNSFVTPVYLTSPLVGMPKEAASSMVLDLLPRVLLPFNFAKSMLNASVAIMLYKPVLAALSKAKIIQTKSASLSFNKNTRLVLIIGSTALAVSVVIFLILA
ncbi:MAG: ECF transporter S component [Clostridia bacterium]|nr:ECF transporter S component [Clostridia bacterium]